MAEPVYAKSIASYEDAAALNAAVEALFAALPAAARITGKRVLIKPNLLGKRRPEQAVTTHPAVFTAVLEAVKRRQPASIMVAESAGGVATPGVMKSIYEVTGLAAACRAADVPYWLGSETGERKGEGRVAKTFTLIQPVLDADFIIDLAKFKTHMMTGMTGAVKNLFGCIPGLQKAEWHMRCPDKEPFGEMLIDLFETVHPDMAIVDAVVAMEGDGPNGGEPRPFGLLLAGQDLPNIDLALCGLIQLDPMRVPYLLAAHRRGLCDERFDPALWQGDAPYAPVEDFKLPGSYRGNADSTGNTDFAQKFPGPLQGLVRRAEGLIAPHPVIDPKKCIGCGNCKEICPQHTIQWHVTKQGGRPVENPKPRKVARVEASGCIRCFCCHEVCPVQAIEVRRLALFRKL